MDPHLTNEDVADILALLDSLPYGEFDLETPRFRLTLRRTPGGWTQSTQVLSAPEPLAAPEPVAAPEGADTVIGIVETMKLMNSVPAGVAGVVAEFCVTNAELVAQGAALLRIRAER